jgi:hypothetical protein
MRSPRLDQFGHRVVRDRVSGCPGADRGGQPVQPGFDRGIAQVLAVFVPPAIAGPLDSQRLGAGGDDSINEDPGFGFFRVFEGLSVTFRVGPRYACRAGEFITFDLEIELPVRRFLCR